MVGAVDGITTNEGNTTVTALDGGSVKTRRTGGRRGEAGTAALASAGGAVTETAGAVVADKLLVQAQNSSALTTATNNVTTVAATITGAGQSLDRKSVV